MKCQVLLIIEVYANSSILNLRISLSNAPFGLLKVVKFQAINLLNNICNFRAKSIISVSRTAIFT